MRAIVPSLASLILLPLLLLGGHPAASVDAAQRQAAGAYLLSSTWSGRPDPLAADAWRWTTGIAVLPDGRAFLVDQATGRLIALQADGTARALASRQGQADDLAAPTYLAADGAGERLFVADPGQDAIKVFDLDGRSLDVWAGVAEPAGLGLAADGSLWVASAGSGELLRLGPDGQRLAAWPVVAAAPGGGLLAGLDVGPDGRVYVADGRQPRIHVLEADGRRVDTLPVDILGLSAFDLRGIAVEQNAGQKSPFRYWAATSEGLWSLDTRLSGGWRRAAVAAAWGVDINLASGIWVTVPESNLQGSRVAILPFTQGGAPAIPSWRGRPVLRPGDLDGPEALSVAVGSDEVAVLDMGDRVQAFSGGAAPLYWAQSPAGAPVRVCGHGSYPAVTDGNGIRRYRRQGDVWDLRWQAAMGPGSQAAALACAPDGQVIALDGLRDRLLRFDDAGQPGATIVLQGVAAGAVWADLDLADDGSLLALDRAGRRLHLVAPDGRQRIVDLPDGARRLAAGPAGGLFTLDRDGWVRRYDISGATARLETAFDAMRFDRADRTAPSDLAVTRDGTVLVSDRLANLVSHYRWSEQATPPDPGEQGSCRSYPAKTAGPSVVALGEVVDLRLSLRGGCGAKVGGATRDIVLVLDNSASMAGEKLDTLRSAARNFVAEVDLSRSRVGVVVFNEDARVAQGLTGDIDALSRALGGIQPAAPDKVTAIDHGLKEARDHLRQRGRPSVPGVIILISDGGSDYDLAVTEADAAKAAAIEIFTIGIQAWQRLMRAVATDDAHAFAVEGARFLYGVFEQIAGSLTAATLFQSITVSDEIPAGFDLVPGSVQPAADWDPAARRLRWQIPGVLPAGFVLRYRLLPRQTGAGQATNLRAWGDYVDGFGQAGRVDFPVPRIDVIGPTATPEPPRSPTPTASATPPPTATTTPRPTETPTPSPQPRPIFVPLILKEKPCRPAEQHADVILAIDSSNSMIGPKLEAAKTAGALFIDLLQLPDDQAAVVSFNSQAVLASPLSGNRAAHRAAIAALGTGAGTRMETGLATALAEMESPRRRIGNTPVIVLLTDGRQDGEPELALAQATRARGQGVAVFTIGLGGDVDRAFLESLAGNPARAFLAPSTADLEGIYRQVAFQVPCPAEVYWARR